MLKFSEVAGGWILATGHLPPMVTMAMAARGCLASQPAAVRSAKFRSLRSSPRAMAMAGHGLLGFQLKFKRPRFMSWVYVSDLPVARVLASCFGSWYLVARVLATYSGAQELPHGGSLHN